MQTGQYGVPEVPAYVVGRGPPAHMFGLSHEMSLASPTPHSHHQHAQHHHLAQQQVAQQQQQQQQQQQVQQAQQQQQHHPHHHPQHQQGHPAQPPQAPQHQQQQQVPPSHHQAQHPQQQQHNQAQQQQQQHQQVQQQVQQSQQQQMVQQLGLAGPDSPEEPSPIASRPSPTGFKQLVQGRESLGEEEAGPDEGDRGAGGNRWPRQETLALIKIRSEMDANFRDSGLKGPLWEDVSRKLAELGYHRSSKKCKEKFENVHKYYKKTKDGRAGRQDGKSYRFFSQLEALYGGSGQGGGGGGGTPGGIGGAGGGVAVASVNHNVPPEPLLLTGGPGSVTTVGGGVGLAGAVEGLVSAQRHTENSSGVNLTDDSDEDYDEPGGDGEDHDNKKKRKRKDWKPGSPRSVSFFENLVKKLMDKQEAMQRKFLEALERREQERLLREDAWRRQEMARQAREFELRSQEHAMSATRDAALVAYLQKVTGQTFNLPQLPQLAPPVPIISMAAVPEPVADEQHQQQQQQAPQQAQQQQHAQDEKSFDPNSKRWPKPEVLHLIRLRSGLESKFQEAGPKGPLWDEISAGMTCMGYSRSSKRCKEKWENINKYFRKTKESNKKRPENAKTCPYFHQLDNLYRKGLLGNPNSKQLQNKVEEHSDELLDPQQQPGGSSRDADSGSYIESDSLFKVGLTM